MKHTDWRAILWRWNRPSCLISDLHFHCLHFTKCCFFLKVCVYIYRYRYIKQFISVRQSYGHTSASARWGTNLGPANQPFWSFEHSPSAPELWECDSITSALLSSLISWIYLLLTQPYIYLIKHRDLFLNLDFPSSCFPPLETPFFFSNPGKTSQQLFSLTSCWEFSTVALQPNLLFAQRQ